eukprot:comp16702_c0_seq1/m.27063 comp16702_c0_seq1/g.27063  ORF comp16702_c0_seq1/g.27063 comp16702_c0_seq1/m.27063 type:complete len:157 (+) comp16702_c0_seq1:138-608(+)
MSRGSFSRSNPNTAFLSTTNGVFSFFFFYVLIVLGFRIAMMLIGLENTVAWTTTFLAQTFVTFFLFHWIKGVPFEGYDQGKYSQSTFWEQIHAEDEGWGLAKKLCMILPLFLYMVCIHYSVSQLSLATLNTAAIALNIVPKLPILHKKRLFGLNAD